MTDVLEVLTRSSVDSTDITDFTIVRTTPDLISDKITLTPVFAGRGRSSLRAGTRLGLIVRREYCVEPPAAHPCTTALVDLRSWLDLPLDDLVSLAGLSPSSRQYWRENPDAPVRPGKAGRLLRLHAAVGLLVGSVGLDEAQAALRREGWLDERLDSTRLASLEDHIRRIVRPSGLSMPAHLAGGLTPELLAQVADPDDELLQQDSERPRRMDSFGPEEPA